MEIGKAQTEVRAKKGEAGMDHRADCGQDQ